MTLPAARPATAARPAPASRSPRVTLGSITAKPAAAPLRVLLHGTEGVGKTTFAAAAPSPIFICPEDGIPRALGGVAHFPRPEGGWTWDDVVDAVRALAQGGHEYRTLVLDTLDWLEPLLFAAICAKQKWESIEEPGYGKGYTAALDGWRALLADLEQLRRSTGMGIVILAHSAIRPFKNPEGEDFDRYELKINAKAAGLWKEWVDAVLFARHDDMAAKDSKTKRVRGVSSGARHVYTVHHAAYDAKNRFGLPERIALDWQEFHAHVEGDATRPAELRRLLTENIALLDEPARGKATAHLSRCGEDVAQLEKLLNSVNAKLVEQADATFAAAEPAAQ